MNESQPADEADFDPRAITRPEPVLLKYYACVAFLTGPGFPIAFLPLYFKYTTLQYKFDEDGVSMRWGILFRREVHLTYRRVQDIHLTRNLIQRWMGLATVAIQTASGSSGPEMSIEGIPQAEALRDFLYSKMRGAHGLNVASPAAAPATSDSAASHAGTSHADTSHADTSHAGNDQTSADESLQLLREIRDALQTRSIQKLTSLGDDADSEGASS